MLIGASISHLELEPLETQCSLTLSDLFNHIYLKSDTFISREHSEQIEWKHYSTPFLVAGYIMEVLGSKQSGVLLLIPVRSHLNSSAVFPWLFIWIKSWGMLWLFVQRQRNHLSCINLMRTVKVQHCCWNHAGIWHSQIGHYWVFIILGNQGHVLVTSHKRKMIQGPSSCHVLQSWCSKAVYPSFPRAIYF